MNIPSVTRPISFNMNIPGVTRSISFKMNIPRVTRSISFNMNVPRVTRSYLVIFIKKKKNHNSPEFSREVLAHYFKSILWKLIEIGKHWFCLFFKLFSFKKYMYIWYF